ncbi:MAG: preprotein translocase subunit SecA, partial [Armatimonadota bacterium]
MNLLQSLSSNEREIRTFRKTVEKITALEPQMQALSDTELRAKTDEFRERIANGESLDELLVEAFAVVREAGCRTLGRDKARHYDVQMIGGIVLHMGRIAEMRTGEGKTLTATLPMYLNALEGKGAHLVTVNDYLSRRDARWYGPIYKFLGMSVGAIRGASMETGEQGGSYVYDPDYEPEEGDHDNWIGLRPVERHEAYICDITYGTNNEYGFDYLRDNMCPSLERLAQRQLNYAIVDEVDSILVDEARTPLIISGIAAQATDVYYKMDKLVRRLVPEKHYTIDEKAKAAMLTEEGTHELERALGVDNLADSANFTLMSHASSALKAHAVFKKDIDYVVKEGQVIIVDEFTGRLMFGRRWSDGLHQAVEAKEGCKIEHESQTLATITFQNYFRLYKKLAGMTGTAKTEENEFRKIYALDVVQIPTNRPMSRKDHADVVYKTQEAKYRGVVAEILSCHASEQPVLVGTRSIEVSELISERLLPERLQLLCATILLRTRLEATKSIKDKKPHHDLLNRRFNELSFGHLNSLAKELGVKLEMLDQDNLVELCKLLGLQDDQTDHLRMVLKDGIVHNVLNAKYHEREAEIIADAGKAGAVTIATNMAGRGVDIILGGPLHEGQTPEERDAEADVVRQRGGMHILGTERHESRRIDNQLRGRSGRQGDPGSSRFYVAFEDELMRLFGDKTQHPLLSGWQEDQSIDSKLLSRMIERAQRKVEEHNFAIRKNVLQYDDVMNVQRDKIYTERRKVLEGREIKDTILGFLEEAVDSSIGNYCNREMPKSEWDYEGLFTDLNSIFPLERHAKADDLAAKQQDELSEFLKQVVNDTYQAREQELGEALTREIERSIMLQVIDRKWMDHLDAMDTLREGISLRGYAQQDPIIAYTKEAFEMFQHTVTGIQEEVARIMYRVQLAPPEPQPVAIPTGFNGSDVISDMKAAAGGGES